MKKRQDTNVRKTHSTSNAFFRKKCIICEKITKKYATAREIYVQAFLLACNFCHYSMCFTK